jgi:putative membrane protein
MSRNTKDYLKISLKGIAMGIADTIPGVSGGTIAFITGIYEELVSSISNVNLRLFQVWKTEGFWSFWKKFNGGFLLALLTGILVSVFSFMRLANYLLKTEPLLVWSFFFGLVLASILLVGKEIKNWRGATLTTLIIGVCIAYGITILPPATQNTSYWYLFISGAFAVCAMILPGISGAFILVLLGSYQTITQAVHDFDFKRILAVALGAIMGLLSFSRVLKWLFNHYKNLTLALLTGFIAGSLNKIWPWKNTIDSITIREKTIVLAEQSVLPDNFIGEPQTWNCILLMLLGFFSILFLERKAAKKQTNNAK